MSTGTMELESQTDEAGGCDPFDLDIRVLEFGDTAATLIEVTDNGCGSSCPKACATNAG